VDGASCGLGFSTMPLIPEQANRRNHVCAGTSISADVFTRKSVFFRRRSPTDSLSCFDHARAKLLTICITSSPSITAKRAYQRAAAWPYQDGIIVPSPRSVLADVMMSANSATVRILSIRVGLRRRKRVWLPTQSCDRSGSMARLPAPVDIENTPRLPLAVPSTTY